MVGGTFLAFYLSSVDNIVYANSSLVKNAYAIAKIWVVKNFRENSYLGRFIYSLFVHLLLFQGCLSLEYVLNGRVDSLIF